jgi:hypothetical protein
VDYLVGHCRYFIIVGGLFVESYFFKYPEIITDDLRLLYRFLNPIRALIKK